MVLVRMATGESWNGIMHDCMTPGDLMSEVVAYLYFSTFVVLGQFMMINLFVAVILENFEREFSSDSTAKVCVVHSDACACACASRDACSPSLHGSR